MRTIVTHLGETGPFPRVVRSYAAKRRTDLQGVLVELDQWLMVYQAVTTTACAKERNYWMSTGIFLVANFLLLLPLAYFALSYNALGGRWFKTALGALGFLICFFWLVTQRWSAREISHWESLLRGIEGQFAGSEFHRGNYKLLHGEQICVPASSWKCNEWYPEVQRISWCGRIGPRVLIVLLSVVFLLGWVALAFLANGLAATGTLV